MKKFEWDYNAMENEYFAYYGDCELGFIEYYEKWKKWVWSQNEGVIMSIECLKNIVKKIEELKCL